VIDVGCAVGENIEEFIRQGIEAYGLEGSSAAMEFLQVPCWRVLFHDLREPITELPWDWHPVDLVLCVEVAEHIEPEFAAMFVNNLKALGKRILITAAPPGQDGTHHVNCQPQEYWEELMKPYSRVKYKEEEIKMLIPSYRKELSMYHKNLMYYDSY